jgi:hypothetical protein
MSNAINVWSEEEVNPTGSQDRGKTEDESVSASYLTISRRKWSVPDVEERYCAFLSFWVERSKGPVDFSGDGQSDYVYLFQWRAKGTF